MTDPTTIAAIASPPGAGLRAIVRVSGTRARDLVRATWAPSAPLPDLARRGLHRGHFEDGRGRQPLLLAWMPGPRSFTGEDVAEFHLPGSPPLVSAALSRLLQLGAVAATAGEFTRRAFLNGRIDLTQAEGVLTLVSAQNEDEARAGIALLCGGLAQRIGAVRDALDELRALCEASLDFDEQDTGHVPRTEIEAGLGHVMQDLAAARGWEDRRTDATGALSIVLAGAPNAGKSALFNALCGEDRALVSDLAGTTRDLVTADLELAGTPIRLVDSAGFDPAARGVDADAQTLAREACAAADVVLWVVDAQSSDLERLRLERASFPEATPCVLVWAKIDRTDAALAPPASLAKGLPPRPWVSWVATSARARSGLSDLWLAVSDALEITSATAAETGLARTLGLRHRLALASALSEVADGRDLWRSGAALEVLAEHLRQATYRLDQVNGRTTPEDVLDRIFARFCIGK